MHRVPWLRQRAGAGVSVATDSTRGVFRYRLGALGWAVFLCALGVTLAAAAHAEEPSAVGDDAAVEELERVVARSQGPEAITALRVLWGGWDTLDPERIEAALAAYATDLRAAPSARAYAGMLAAYARRRRGDLDGAERRIEALGFVRHWLVVGPFENQNRSGLAERFMPELELDAPVLFDRSYRGKERAVVWRAAPDVHRLGWIDLGSMVRPSHDVCVYASTFVQSERERPATLFVGATGAFKLFFDADEVLADGGYRELDAERYAVPVVLKAGVFHRVTAKVCGAHGSPAFTLRLSDENGEPLRDVVVEATERASASAAVQLRERRLAEAAGLVGKSKGRPGGPTKSDSAKRLLPVGGIQAFDARLLAAPNDAVVLESYARYLVTTGGDSEDEPHARRMAERAARSAPNLPRLLLAARLAEDRNERRTWLNQAEPLARTDAERVAWLRAQSQLIRSGPSAHDAALLYRELVRKDPHDVVGRLGLVERSVEAGLPRTALAELLRELEVRPHSLAFLRAAAMELRKLGRDVEALSLEGRYAAYLFDDASVLDRRLQLAVAQRDITSARSWGERLLRVQPTSAWAHAEVAESQRSLGDVHGALTTYRRMLANAPEDTPTMRAVADIYGDLGQKAEELELLRTVVRLAPQDAAARDYLERLEPRKSRDDERYAWSAEVFQKLAAATPRAGAVTRTLRNLTVTTLYDSGRSSHFYQRVFQPLTEDAAKRQRRYGFTYHADRQVVELRGVRVFRTDGRIDETVTTGEAPLDDPSINMYTLERAFYVQLPELHAGDIVEVRYRIDDVSVQSDRVDYVAEVEYLRESESVASAEYVLSAPSGRALFIHATGLPGLKETTSVVGDRTIRRFEAHDLASAPAEPGQPPLAETLGYVHVSSFANWAAVGSWYWGLAKEKIAPDEDIRRRAEAVTRGKTDLASRVAAVYRYAASETRYVALEFGIEGIRPRRASLTLARGWGDCKDKAALLVAMLGSIGIDAELVLVRTGLRGRFDPTVASLAPFDHAIAYVPALELFLDGTAEATGSAELPQLDRGALALRITGGEGRLVVLPEITALPTVDTQEFNVAVESDGSFRFDGTLVSQGFQAADWRNRYHAEGTRRERVAADLLSVLGAVELDANGVEVGDLDALEAPVTLRVRGRATAARDGVAWSLPMGRRTQLVANYAALPTRAGPLLVGAPRVASERWTIQVPPEARVLALPAVVTLDGPAARYELKVERNGQQLVIRRTLEWHKSRVEPGEYGAWRAFCRGVDAAGAPRVLLAR